jgi:hypothetical protein
MRNVSSAGCHRRSHRPMAGDVLREPTKLTLRSESQSSALITKGEAGLALPQVIGGAANDCLQVGSPNDQLRLRLPSDPRTAVSHAE